MVFLHIKSLLNLLFGVLCLPGDQSHPFAQPTINPLACCICWAGLLGRAVFPPWNEGPNFGSYNISTGYRWHFSVELLIGKNDNDIYKGILKNWHYHFYKIAYVLHLWILAQISQIYKEKSRKTNKKIEKNWENPQTDKKSCVFYKWEFRWNRKLVMISI